MSEEERIHPITDYRRCFFFIGNDGDSEEHFLAAAFFNSNRVIAFTSRYSRTDAGVDRNCMEVLLMVKGTVYGIGSMQARMQGFYVGPFLDRHQAMLLQDVIFNFNVDSEAWECNMLVDQICTGMGHVATAARIVDNAFAEQRGGDWWLSRGEWERRQRGLEAGLEPRALADDFDLEDDATSAASTVSSDSSDDGAVCSGASDGEPDDSDEESTVEWRINVYDTYPFAFPPHRDDPVPDFIDDADEDSLEREHIVECGMGYYNEQFEQFFKHIVDWYLDDIAFNNISTDEPPEKKFRETMVELACEI